MGVTTTDRESSIIDLDQVVVITRIMPMVMRIDPTPDTVIRSTDMDIGGSTESSQRWKLWRKW